MVTTSQIVVESNKGSFETPFYLVGKDSHTCQVAA